MSNLPDMTDNEARQLMAAVSSLGIQIAALQIRVGVLEHVPGSRGPELTAQEIEALYPEEGYYGLDDGFLVVCSQWAQDFARAVIAADRGRRETP